MSAGTVLLHLLVVLAAAKLGGELAERVSLPGVVGEIVAGIVVGPSLLGLVPHDDEALRVMGELGVIILLLEVGLQLDLDELREVGGASLAVATIGVVVPFALGWAGAAALGHGGTTAVFVGAALTATSVGITARVFADLRALVTPEARTVLGAAVADDVMGLVVLTVVVRLATGDDVTVVGVAGVVALALAFLVVATVVGVVAGPAAVAAVRRLARSPGSLLAVVLVITLGFAELADAARLAPIVGAFVAGLALARSDAADRVRHEIAPVAHVFVPVFFLLIGVDADIGAFARPSVLGLAAVLLAAGVVGKLVAAFGVGRARGDKLVIGLGMLPRGEVGLIFATIGLREGVLGDDLYAALLLVVLATTLVAPPLLRRRMAAASSAAVRPGSLADALRTATAAASGRPDASALDALVALDAGPLRWDADATAALVALLRRGSARSWRLLDGSGVLERALPELAASLRRQRDPFDLDPPELVLVDAVRDRLPDDEVRHPDRLLLAALALDAAGDGDPRAVARRLVARLGLAPEAADDVGALVADAGLLRHAALRPDALDETQAAHLAAHVGRLDRLRMLEFLATATDDLEPIHRSRVDELVSVVRAVLRDAGGAELSLVDRRRLETQRRAPGDRAVAERVEHAPWAYVLAHSADDLVRHARLLDPVPVRRNVRVAVTPFAPGEWRVDIAARDRRGLLAVVTAALADQGDVRAASIATWPDGGAIESFVVARARPPDDQAIAAAVERTDYRRLGSAPLPDAIVEFDDGAPWHTRVEVRAGDHAGLLHELAVAFCAAGCDVHAASVETQHGVAVDRFDVTDRRGRKLDLRGRAVVDAAIRAGVQGRRDRTITRTKHKGNGREISASYGRLGTPEVQRRRHVCEGEQSDSPA